MAVFVILAFVAAILVACHWLEVAVNGWFGYGSRK